MAVATDFRQVQGLTLIGQPAVAPERFDIDYRLDEFVLDPTNRAIKAVDAGEAITGSGMTLSIEEANQFTLDILDVKRSLLRGDFLTGWAWGKNADDRNEAHWVRDGRKIEARIDDLDLQLMKVTKQTDTLTLTFEEQATVRLREHKGARQAVRFDTHGGVTRAQFVKSLCDAAKVATYIPEVDKRPPIVPVSTQLSASEKRSQGAKGIDPSANLVIGGYRLRAPQLKNAEIALDTADAANAPTKATLALLEACIVEPAGTVNGKQYHPFDNPPGGDGTSQGILQLTSPKPNRRDVASVCSRFLRHGFTGRGGAISLARRNPHMSPGEIAQACQGSAYPARYEQHRREAERVLRAYKPGFSGGGTQVQVQVQKPYEFSRGKNESSWDAIQRLADEVGWRAFVRKGVLWFVSEEWLFTQKPQLVFRERRPGETEENTTVDNVDFDIDLNARDLVSEISVSARASRWTAMPGMVAVAKGLGPADGRWIVQTAEKGSLLATADDVTITCHKPMPVKKEPAPEVQQQQFDLGGTGGTRISGASGALQVAYAVYLAAKRISDTGIGYSHAGHGIPMKDVRTHGGLDCSSSVSLALYRAGVFPHKSSAFVSGDFNHWGKAGRGKYMTVWYNGGHVYIQFEIPGLRAWRFDTSQHPGRGPRVVNTPRSHAGFAARHWHR